ncbi:cupin [Streptomyces somaliensis]|uniref:cupin n=1 Tax=Streptomyces somaliensis TaxID=78355 RepID=UPI0020CFB9FC|nr:cupin [Streptomyces somaliensis]MCP9944204.1 cupin [Streptomyces somaliensis]MCP9962558.1 cupin [Streptomyces somaliensis]MCP9975385.1 cupin [Streptomyces somaliensis]
MYDLHAIAEEHLAAAHRSEHGRSANLLLRERPLRQTVIALTAGTRLDEHNAPPAASLQVLRGVVKLKTASEEVELTMGDLFLIPPERHGLTAVTDTAFLLTAVND